MRPTTVALQGFDRARVAQHQVKTHADLWATDNLVQMTNVAPRYNLAATVTGGRLILASPPLPCQMIRVAVQPG